MKIFTGYHGTDEYGATRIDQNGFEDSPSDSWLGPGIYFFETQAGFDGQEAAEWWATKIKNHQKWVILESEIGSDSVFDLFGSREDRYFFGKLKHGFLKKHVESGGTERAFNLKPVFLFISKKFEVIRGLVDAARLDKFVNFVVGYPQIQICVTRSRCIHHTHTVKTWREQWTK
jgi:hypothetical protein